MKRIFLLAILVALLCGSSSTQVPAPSPFDLIKFFVGRWQGTSEGEPGRGNGERTYEFVLGGRFLRSTNRTVYPKQEKNPKGEVHEDIGFFSFDRQQKRLVLRQFHVEGFVNEYVQQNTPKEGKTLVFETEQIENIPAGWKARETYRIVNQDEFTEVFELAEPRKRFAVYSESRWKRMK